jgi:clathrin heavy chain
MVQTPQYQDYDLDYQNMNSMDHDEYLRGFLDTQNYYKILPYCKQANYTPDFVKILRIIIPQNPSAAFNMAWKIVEKDEKGVRKCSLIDLTKVFIEANMIRELTAIMLIALKGNSEKDARLQTKLLEVNIK